MSDTQNIDSVMKVLEGTPMEEYAQAFLDGGNKYWLSAVYLAAKSRLETGGGTSTLARGNVAGYQGYYNFYGINATDGTNSHRNAAAWAKEHGWDSPYQAIVEGACTIKTSYILKGQDTLYGTKWDIQGYLNSGRPTNQWATNIADAYNKSLGVSSALKNVDAPLTFKIPVYNNMP